MLGNAAQVRTLQRRSFEPSPVPIDPSAQTLQLATAANVLGVHRLTAEALGVPINAESGLVAANAAQGYVVVRGTMEAVL